MKKICLLIMFTISMFICSCSKYNINFVENVPKHVNPNKSFIDQNNGELTIFYPYWDKKDEYKQIFNKLNELSKNDLSISVRMPDVESSLYLRGDTYTNTLKIFLDSGFGPDIFVTYGTYNIQSRNLNRVLPEEYKMPNDLLYLIKSGYIADITKFINGETPYLLEFYNKYYKLLPSVGYQSGVYGICLPISYLSCPVFVIERNINRQLEKQNLSTLQDAINACSEIFEKDLITPHDLIIFQAQRNILLKIINDREYYTDWDLEFMYYFKKDDLKKTIYRIDDTPILDDIKIYLDIFKEYSITTDINILNYNKSKSLLAGVIEYGMFLYQDFNLDKSIYDVYFLNDLPAFPSYQLQHLEMFVINSACNEKQTAVKYLDWLYSDPNANLLMKYGIKNRNYKIDYQLNLLYVDKTVSNINNISLFRGYTVDNGILLPESLYGNFNDEGITDTIITSFDLYPFHEMMIDNIMRKEGSIITGLTKIYNSPEYGNGKYRFDEGTLGSLIPYMFEEKTAYNKYTYYELYEKIIETRNDKFIQDIQDVINECF